MHFTQADRASIEHDSTTMPNVFYAGATERLSMRSIFISASLLLTALSAFCGPVPSARQLKWHEVEVFGMVNFSTITYYGKEWGYGDEDAGKFNPTEFDARQIVRAAKAG